MEKEINLPSNGGYHFGRMIDLKKYEGSYFENNEADKLNLIYKAIISSIVYKPDELYNTTYGNDGNCWRAIIQDLRLDDDIYIYKFNFRNFSDLIKYYESQDMKFCP